MKKVEPKYARRQLEVQFAISMGVFKNLEAQERETETDREQQAQDQLTAVSGLSAWWAQVPVTPEDSSSAVFNSGTPQALIVANECAGSRLRYGPAVGHLASYPCQISALSKSPSHGTEKVRA